MRSRAWLAPALAATTACAAGSAGSRPPCAAGLAFVDGACLGPKETDDYCGGRSIAVGGSGSCVVPTCAPGEAIDPVTSTCVARRAIAALGPGGERGVGDEAIVGCGEGRVLTAHHEHVECLAREQICPPTARWDSARGCVTDPPCKAGEVRVRGGADTGTCRPFANASVVDVGAWTRTTLENQLCRRLRRTPWDFVDSAPEGRVSLELDLVFPNNDVAGASAVAHFDPPVPSEAAQASAQAALEALLIPLRALGGTADAASVSLHVTCPMDRGAAPRILHQGQEGRGGPGAREGAEREIAEPAEPIPRATEGSFSGCESAQSGVRLPVPQDRARAYVDSDLADAVEGLKAVFAKRKIDSSFAKAPAELVEALKKQLRIPPRFRGFLLAANPARVETVTPVERIRLIPAEELVKSQATITAPTEGPVPLDWKPAWVIIGESSLLGDPYFLDTSKPDPEGDCPVYTAMSGQERWAPTLAASSFAQFLRILSTAMEIAAGFGDAIMDDEDEDSFREALGPKVKIIDAAALRAGHWT